MTKTILFVTVYDVADQGNSLIKSNVECTGDPDKLRERIKHVYLKRYNTKVNVSFIYKEQFKFPN